MILHSAKTIPAVVMKQDHELLFITDNESGLKFECMMQDAMFDLQEMMDLYLRGGIDSIPSLETLNVF